MLQSFCDFIKPHDVHFVTSEEQTEEHAASQDRCVTREQSVQTLRQIVELIWRNGCLVELLYLRLKLDHLEVHVLRYLNERFIDNFIKRFFGRHSLLILALHLVPFLVLHALRLVTWDFALQVLNRVNLIPIKGTKLLYKYALQECRAPSKLILKLTVESLLLDRLMEEAFHCLVYDEAAIAQCRHNLLVIAWVFEQCLDLIFGWEWLDQDMRFLRIRGAQILRDLLYQSARILITASLSQNFRYFLGSCFIIYWQSFFWSEFFFAF